MWRLNCSGCPRQLQSEVVAGCAEPRFVVAVLAVGLVAEGKKENVSFLKKIRKRLAYLGLLLGLLLRLLLSSGSSLLCLLLGLLLGSLLRLLLMNHCSSFVCDDCGVRRVWIETTVDQSVVSVQLSFRGESFATGQTRE